MTLSPARFLVAAAVAGLAAAVALPGERLGVGVLLVAVALLGVLVVVGLRDAPSRVWAALALLLAAAPVLRDAAWVVLPALGGALVCGSLAVAGGRTWPGVAWGAIVALAGSAAGPGSALRAARLATPGDARARALPAARAAALAAGLVLVFGALFASADPAFAQLAEDALPDPAGLDLLPLRVLAFAGVVALSGGLALGRGTGAGPGDPPAPRHRLGRVEWVAGLAALVALFAAFVAVQFAVLFGQDDHVLRTAGLTYAEYAREGFAQLLLVAGLVLAVVACALRYGPADRRTAVRALLVVLVALAFVVLVSARHRLGLYEDAFGATRLRFAAGWAIVVVAALLAVVLAALAAGRSAWLPRAVALTGAVALLGLVAADPDRRIAERNVERLERTGEVDGAYLGTLSADAIPALPAELRPPVPDRDGWAGWSLARARARAAR